MEIKTVLTENAPAPGGHYSQAVVYNGLVFVAGQLAIKPTGERVLDSIEAQTEQAMANVIGWPAARAVHFAYREKTLVPYMIGPPVNGYP